MEDNKRRLNDEDLNHVSGGDGENIPHSEQGENIPHESLNTDDLEKKRKR